MVANQNAFEDNSRLKQELKAKEDELEKIRTDAVKLQKVNEGIAKKLKAADEQRIEVEGARDSFKTQLGAMERELDAARRQVESDKKQLEDLARGRDVITKKLMSAGRETEAQEALVKVIKGD